MVLKAGRAIPASHKILTSIGYGSTLYPSGNGNLSEGFGSSVPRNLGNPLTKGIDITQWHTYNVSAKTNQWSARINGQVQLQATSNTVFFNTNTWSPPQLGSSYYSFDGQIAEVIIYDRVLSHEERTGAQSYLQQKHRLDDDPPVITILLPTNTNLIDSQIILP